MFQEYNMFVYTYTKILQNLVYSYKNNFTFLKIIKSNKYLLLNIITLNNIFLFESQKTVIFHYESPPH